MSAIPKKIQTWQMVHPTVFNKETKESTPGKLEKTEIPVSELNTGEVLVEVAGCGVCHTDLGYFYDGVPTVSKPPLTLGHEISGTVIAGDDAWIGKEVIIPAVMPCRQCILCKTGRGNRCLNQKMPGNSIGLYGGFSSHIPVPSIDLCEVKDRGNITLSHLAVVADAATTPYQAAKRADLQPGDNVVIVGITGGVGQYMGQMANALGAKTVIGIARNQEKLDRALKYYERSVKIRAKIGATGGFTPSITNIGDVQLRKVGYDRAIEPLPTSWESLRGVTTSGALQVASQTFATLPVAKDKNI